MDRYWHLPSAENELQNIDNWNIIKNPLCCSQASPARSTTLRVLDLDYDWLKIEAHSKSQDIYI